MAQIVKNRLVYTHGTATGTFVGILGTWTLNYSYDPYIGSARQRQEQNWIPYVVTPARDTAMTAAYPGKTCYVSDFNKVITFLNHFYTHNHSHTNWGAFDFAGQNGPAYKNMVYVFLHPDYAYYEYMKNHTPLITLAGAVNAGSVMRANTVNNYFNQSVNGVHNHRHISDVPGYGILYGSTANSVSRVTNFTHSGSIARGSVLSWSAISDMCSRSFYAYDHEHFYIDTYLELY